MNPSFLLQLAFLIFLPSVFGCYTSIFNFGDSLSDTGNLYYTCSSPDPAGACFFPYGETFFHRPTGRFSDGRVVLDFFGLSVSSALSRPYNAIFNFGDSLSDTGNFLRSGSLAFPVIGKLPYGETFFKHATGRCSDGRLVIDFIAEAFGLPHLPPYLGLKQGQNFSLGVNFAVAGATALDAEFFYKRKIGTILWTNHSLNVQLGWFRKLKSSLCTSTQECEKFMKKSLFMVGEIGGNDYNYAYFVGGSINEIQSLVPLVVEAITGATAALIEEGAMELVVPGNLPIGCSAVYLTLFQSPNRTDYDENGCLKAFSDFAKYHNNHLKRALHALNTKYPFVRIVYGDYYGAAIPLVHAPKHHGFYEGALKACCGGGGPYNFNNSARCGHMGSKACENPGSYVNWDGIHLTEAAYSFIAKALLRDLPPLLT